MLKLIRVLLFCLVVILIPTLTFFGKHETVSYNENKVLADLPKFSVTSYKDKSFMDGIADYFSDHFFMRESWIMLKNSADKAIGKTEIKGVFKFNGSLNQVFVSPDDDQILRQASFMNTFSEKCNCDVYCALVPTSQEQFRKELPGYYDIGNERDAIRSFYNELDKIKSIDLLPALTATQDNYYRTDHHWNSVGAHKGFLKIIEDMGIQSSVNVDPKVVSNEFKGTLYSKTLDDSVQPDEIIELLPAKEYEYDVHSFEGEEHYSSLYFPEHLKEKDKYLYFLGGNYGLSSIKNPRLQKGNLLLFKDSYANAVLPLLAEVFENITVVDLRYASPSELETIVLNEYDSVLFLYNCDGFFQEKSLASLNLVGE